MLKFDINWKIPETSGNARVKFNELQPLLHHWLLGARHTTLVSDQDESAADQPQFLRFFDYHIMK